ncbi:MAG: PAS domain S-box protein, partial [Deltaproteobacteria bacterium]|nr:PAS domain S-box protein [Deltaproteobacteria bacterium]
MEYVADRIFGTGKNWLSNTLYIGLILLAVIFWLSFFKYTVFHTLVELAAVLVSLLAFTVAWSTFPFTRNSYLMFLGTGYLWVGILDLIHLATLRDLQLLVLPDNNINAQFWLAARFMEVSVLIGAVLFARRNLVPWLMMALFCLACGVLYWLIFTGKFPDAFLDTGLTPFKVYSEYAIILLLVVAAGLTYIRRPSTSELVFLLLLGSILVTILSEFLFTLYSNVDSWPNVTGHLTKFVSFWMIFIAIARATLTEPFRALSREAHTYDVVPESIALIDSDLIIRQVNRKARKIAGAGAGELIGRHCHEVFHAGLATPEECPVCDRIRKGERGEPLVLEDDEGRHFEFNLSPIGAHMGPMGSVQVMRDVTLVVKSRQEIDSFFESALDMHCIVDRQGRFKRINKAFLNLLGVTEGEAIGRPFRSFIHPDDLERSGEAFQALLRGEPIANFENRFLDSDGKEHWLNWQATMDQKVDRVLAMARDVTQQKKLEHEIRSGERLLQTVLDTIPNWLWVKDVSGRYLMVNRAMAEFFRLEPQQVAGRTFAEISFDPPEKIENNSRLDRQVIE